LGLTGTDKTYQSNHDFVHGALSRTKKAEINREFVRGALLLTKQAEN